MVEKAYRPVKLVPTNPSRPIPLHHLPQTNRRVTMTQRKGSNQVCGFLAASGWSCIPGRKEVPTGVALMKYVPRQADSLLLDSAAMVSVVFFDLITNENTRSTTPTLAIDLCSLLAAVNTWVLTESRRCRVWNLFLRRYVQLVDRRFYLSVVGRWEGVGFL